MQVEATHTVNMYSGMTWNHVNNVDVSQPSHNNGSIKGQCSGLVQHESDQTKVKSEPKGWSSLW